MYTQVLLMLTTALALVSGSATTRGAQEVSDVQRVVRTYKEALGGRSRVMSIRTREIRGTFEYQGVGQHGTGQLHMRWKAPNSLVEQLKGPMGSITRGFDGTRAWGRHPQAGVRRISPFEVEEILLMGVLYQPILVRHLYGEPTYEGRVKVDGRDTEVLSATRRGGWTDRFYFDVVTGLPLQLDVWEEGPEAIRDRNSGEAYLAHYRLDDYRIIDGVAVPHFIRRKRPNSTMTFRFDEVRHNVTLPDSIFREPDRSSDR